MDWSGQVKQKGFTLMELLVVLVLISLLMTTLMQGLSYFLKLKERGSELVLTQQKTKMQEDWFKLLIQGFTPYQRFSKKVFKGNKTELTGQTLTTLTSSAASIVDISLKLEQTSGMIRLIYVEGNYIWRLGEWVSKEAHLSYQDREGNMHKSWPPKGNNEITQLPALIKLHVSTSQESIDWFVSIAGRLTPKPTIKELLF